MTYTRAQRQQAREMVSRALEVAPVEQVLREMNLQPHGEESGLDGEVGFADKGITVIATPEWERWHVYGSGFTRDMEVVLCGEVMLPAVQARGKTVLAVLDMWRALYGNQAILPPVLYLGQVYQASQRSMAKLKIGTPLLHLDGPVLRQTIKWLRQRTERDLATEPGVERLVTLEFDGKLLRLEVGGHSYGVPGRGHWALPCSVGLDDLLALPAAALRGGWVRMALEANSVCLNGYHLPAPFDEADG